MISDAQSLQRQPAHISPGSTFPLDGPGPEQINIHAAVTAGSRPSAGNAVQHARDGSITRGRIPGAGITSQVASGMPVAVVAATQQPRAASAQRAPLDTSHARIAGHIDTGLQRRASNNYGHHRQTSVIHGLQHSRNPSFNSPNTASPLSPDSLHSANPRVVPTMRRAAVVPPETTPTFAHPISPESGHVQSHSIDSALGVEILSSDLPITPGRRHTTATRAKKGHVYGASGSSAELRTPGEFALHHLFHSFVIRADQKINQCLSNLETLVAPVEQVCGRGADPSFDQLITALGHVARQEPKPLVDSLMLWRKAKGDAASAYKKQLYQHRINGSGGNNGTALPLLPRRNTEPVNGESSGLQTFPGSSVGISDEGPDEYMQADRRATISVFILCRVLVEVFEQSNIDAITSELATKLEDIVFTQLKDVEPAQITQSSLRLANWRIYGELLGHMSKLSFPHVASRFSTQLETWQQEIAKSTGTVGARELETRVELLLHSMRNLHINSEQTMLPAVGDFLRSLANLFVESHGPTIKQAYCQTLEKLLVQVAGEPERLQNVPRFREFSDVVNSRLTQMLSKPRHWSSALPLSTILLCFSPMEVFSVQWLQVVNSLSQKLRDRGTRTQAMRAICQLLWTYLHRTTDQAAIRLRRVEEAMKLAFPSTKKNHVNTEASMSEALVYFVRIVGSYYPDLCFRNVIFPLINYEVFISAREMRIEQMEPEKMVIGIRSFLAMISDLEKGIAGRPGFPSFTITVPVPDGAPMSPNPAKSRFGNEIISPPLTKPVLASLVPVDQSRLDDLTAQRYRQFCEALGKITIVCDQTFGSSAVLNERFAAATHVLTPKTPLVDAFTLARKEESSLPDQKQSYYELLHVAIQALPRCFSDQAPLNNLINLLCTGSSHVQVQIASSAARSLKAIAQQGYAQAVAIAFPRFIFQYDSQYSTMSDEGRLGPAHIEATLTLYIELLQIWMNQLRHKVRGESKDKLGANSSRALQMEITNTCSLVDETEAYGLFFLCSQSRRVRAFAIKVLQLILQFDEVLGKEDSARVIRVLEAKSSEILDLDISALSVAERIRLEKDTRRPGGQSTIIEISSSENTYDATLWFKGFPNLIRNVNDLCPNAIALSRVIVCDRLVLMQPDVEKLAATGSGSASDLRLLGRSAATPIEVFFDQWKLYLVMACVTLSSPGAQSQSQLANAAHVRKTSRNVGNMQEKLSSARALFSAVIPMLGAAPDAIRQAVVIALGAINRKLYRTLLESLQYAVITCNDEAKLRLGSHQRTPSSPHRSQVAERMRTEVTHIYKLTAAFLRFSDVLEDEWILNNLFNYTRDLRIFLSDAEVQSDWRFLKIRCHYCGLVEELYANVGKSSTPSRWMPFESRKSAFTLMEEWCGFAPESGHNARPEDAHHGGGNPQPREYNDRANANAALEKEKNSLRIAALSAMAALCAGPVCVVTETNTTLQFNVLRMLAWADTIFATGNDKMHAIGQRALRLLLLSNADQPQLIEHAIQHCYSAKNSRALESYFSVVTDVLSEQPNYPIAPTRILGAVMFTLGNENREIRMKSANLLRVIDDREQKQSNLQEFDISISDKTRAVYKRAQFEYSRRLANAHPELAFAIISEFAYQFRRVSTDHQRNMVAAILPWFQIVELQVDPMTNGPTAVSYILLSNMLEITVKFSTALHNEVQALWQALATGPHAGNVQMVLDFIINLSLDRREQNFVEYAKQIVVHLSTTPAGSRVLEFLLMQLVPKNMINERKQLEYTVPDVPGMAYVADLNTLLPTGHKQAGLSLGQVSLIFLVDLMVPPITLKKEDVVKLVHVVAILWDHYTIAVQEHAREMLVHLIHELVTTKLTEAVFKPQQHQIEELVEAIRGSDSNVTWSYEDHAGKDETESVGNRVPASMTYLTEEVAGIFALGHEAFCALWAKEALQWASICPVRHLACRSFQVFRCISSTLDARMLADMLARLSNTIADEQTDYQTFSLEILTTLRVIITSLEPQVVLKHPQLFWTTCACLDTIHESEFFETLAMLQKLLSRVDFSDPSVIEIFMHGKPTKWEGVFEGVQPLVYKGLRSANCLDRTLSVLHDLAILPNSNAIGEGDRLLYNVLANLPQFLYSFDADVAPTDILIHAERLAMTARKENHLPLAACLEAFAMTKYTNAHQCLTETVRSIAATYLPECDAQSLIFLFSLLTNQTSWFRVKVMDILCEIIPLIDMRNTAITRHGPDLITPLLRLLQTEHCSQALGVMDHIMEVSCTPMDKHHLRMSMASGSSKAMRKEYERTESLYGIPMPSGWSIPMPAVHSNLTRNNVHAVFFTCGDADTTEDKSKSAPEFEFHKDDGYAESYLPNHASTESMRTLETAIDVNMGDIVSTLDSLDDFFDDTDSAATPTVHDPRSPTYFPSSIPEHDTSTYDEQTAPILSRSLARTSSSLSFQNGLAESRPPTSHQHRQQPSLSSNTLTLQHSFSSIDELSGPGPSMSDIAKALPPTPSILNPAVTRPGLHARSITSPANQFPVSHPTSTGFVPTLPALISHQAFSDTNLPHDDAFSDSEGSSPFPLLTTTFSNPVKNVSTPILTVPASATFAPTSSSSLTAGLTIHQSVPLSAVEAGSSFSFRRGMRRLTGGKSESAKEKARLRAASGSQNSAAPGGLVSGSSPRVPRVPLEYLSGNVAANVATGVQQQQSGQNAQAPAGAGQGSVAMGSPLSPEGTEPKSL